jgi:hypothetical protein
MLAIDIGADNRERFRRAEISSVHARRMLAAIAFDNAKHSPANASANLENPSNHLSFGTSNADRDCIAHACLRSRASVGRACRHATSPHRKTSRWRESRTCEATRWRKSHRALQRNPEAQKFFCGKTKKCRLRDASKRFARTIRANRTNRDRTIRVFRIDSDAEF